MYDHCLFTPSEFCYTRPECGPNSREWGGLCQRGQNQSPIDIDRSYVSDHPGKGPVYVNADYRQSQDFIMMNSGHTGKQLHSCDNSCAQLFTATIFLKIFQWRPC